MNVKRQNEKVSHQYDQLSEEYKPKQELGKGVLIHHRSFFRSFKSMKILVKKDFKIISNY